MQIDENNKTKTSKKNKNEHIRCEEAAVALVDAARERWIV